MLVLLTVDANGNVLTYGDKEYTWNSGRNLESIVDGDNKYSYTYDENGIRTSKTVNGKTTYYNTKDGVILSQTDGTSTWYFQYDTNGSPLGFVLNGTQYFYITNQMGDVLAITDTNGDIVANYEYDAWGKVLTADTNIAKQNPLRYRGYYYDNETGYYYLQSRYYDSNICRFINTDIPEISQMSKNISVGTNLFAYCCNDSVNNSDPNGHFKVRRWMIATPLDLIFMATPAGALFAPIKSAGRAFGTMVVKKQFSARIFKLVNWLSANIIKYVSKIVNAIKSIKILKNIKFIKNLSAKRITAGFLGFALIKTPTYKLLNILIKNVDIVLSLGGFISGLFDLCFDKSLNNVIWNI